MDKVEALVESMISQLVTNQEVPSLRVPHIDSVGIIADDYDSFNVSKTKKLGDLKTSQNYSQIMSILAQVSELLASKRTMSQRDVYYTLKHMFNKPNDCNNAILDVGLILGLKRYEMGIVPATKGLIAGLIRFRFLLQAPAAVAAAAAASQFEPDDDYDDGAMREKQEPHWVDGVVAGRERGVPISSLWMSAPDDILEIEIGEGYGAIPQYLLVIEKECVFQRLCDDNFHIRIPSIMVTGCGKQALYISLHIMLYLYIPAYLLTTLSF